MRTLDNRDFLFANFIELKKASISIIQELEVFKVQISGYSKIQENFKKFYKDELCIHSTDPTMSNQMITETSDPNKKPREGSPKRLPKLEDEAVLQMTKLPEKFPGFDDTDPTIGESFLQKTEDRLSKFKDCLSILEDQFRGI